MQDVYKNIEEYNLGKKSKVLIVFDDVIADMISNEELDLLFYCTTILQSTKRS